MATLSQAKTYGGVGSILVLLSFVPTVGWVLGIIGLILTLLAVKYIGDVVNDANIFKNAMIAYAVSIIGIAVVGIAVAAYFFGAVGLGALAGGSSGAATGGIIAAITGVIIALVVVWILLVVSGYFIRKTYDIVATRLNVSMFRTAALVYFIGAILTIILVGFLVLIIAQILLVIAFFSISDTVTPYAGGMPPPSPAGYPPTMSGSQTTMGAPAAASKFCVKCGAALAQDAMFCPSCGASQTTSM